MILSIFFLISCITLQKLNQNVNAEAYFCKVDGSELFDVSVNHHHPLLQIVYYYLLVLDSLIRVS